MSRAGDRGRPPAFLEEVDAFAARFCHVTTDHARQRDDGAYYRTNKPLDRDTILAHLRGTITVAPYLMGVGDTVRVGVLDHDDKRWVPDPANPREGRSQEEDGLALLQDARERLQRQGIDSALEESRRGGHLWVFPRETVKAEDMRALLLLAVGRDERRAMLHGERAFEIHPAANHRPQGGVGDNMRLPLGVQRKELGDPGGGRHPFIDRNGRAVADTIGGQLRYALQVEPAHVMRHLGERAWLREALEMIESKPWQYQRAPSRELAQERQERAAAYERGPERVQEGQGHIHAVGRVPGQSPIQEWVRQVSCRDVVESYGIPIAGNGQARCPWPEHHSNGDQHPSFTATERGWRCWSSGEHGNAYDFVARMEGYNPADLRGKDAMEVLKLCVERVPAPLSVDLNRSEGPRLGPSR